MRKQQINKQEYHCRDCEKSYDWHEIGWDGKPFLCRCPHEKFCKFLDDKSCNDNFVLKKT